MSPFLSKSPNAKFNATSAGGMQLTAVDVCSPIARLLLNFYPAEGYGIKFEGSFLVRKVRVVVFRNVFIFFVSTTFGHNLHRIELKICGCDLSMV